MIRELTQICVPISDVTIEVVPTTIPSLDAIIGGGFPKGRVITIVGKGAAGKTTLVCTFLENVVKLGGVAIFVDTDFTLTGDRLRQLGLTHLERNLMYIEGTNVTLENLFSKIHSIVQVLSQIPGYEFGFMAIDPFSTLVSESELAGSDSIANYAKQMSSFARRALALLKQHNLGLIFVVHEKSGINIMYGGSASSYLAQNTLYAISSLELRVTRGKKLQTQNTVFGHEVIFEVRKNKIAPPFQKAVAALRFNGYDRALGALAILVDAGVIQKKGGWYSLPDGTKFQYGASGCSEEVADKIMEEWERYISNMRGEIHVYGGDAQEGISDVPEE